MKRHSFQVVWTTAFWLPIGLLGFSSIILAEEGKWTTLQKADMPTARAYFSASVVNGKIYVIGGSSTAAIPLSTVEEYDPIADKWTKKASIPTPRIFLTSSVVNGKIYAIGGWLGFRMPFLSTVDEYDPAINKWTRKADMPTPRHLLASSAVNMGSFMLSEVGPGRRVWLTFRRQRNMIR